MYKHLIREQRYQIAALKKAGFGVNKIGSELGISPSTISRELKRNRLFDRYNAEFAQKIADKRQREKTYKCKFTPGMQKLVEEKLQRRWSPEQIVGRCKMEHTPMVSVERLYQFIWKDKANGGFFHRYLRHGIKKYGKRGAKSHLNKIANKVSIDYRPAIVDQKAREGDWEIDTIIGQHHKGAIVTSVERKTQFTLLAKVDSMHGKKVQRAVINMLAPYKSQVLTITSDNGVEFCGHQHIAKRLEADYYFAHPYSSWERGLIEYQNKLIRQYIPKSTDLKKQTYERILHIQKELNQRPRKKLHFKTPNEVFLNFTVALTG